MPYETLSLSRARTRFHFDNLGSLLSEQLTWLERAHREEQEDLWAKLEEVRDGVISVYGDDVWTDADVEFFQEQYGGDDPDDPERVLAMFKDIYPRNVVYSYVMLLTMHFESELRFWCDLLAEQRRVPRFDDWSAGSTLDKFRRYVNGDLALALEAKYWDRLPDLMRVRNCIAHNGGRIKAHDNRLRAIVNREPGLELEDDAPGRTVLVASGDYCRAMLELIVSFFSALFDCVGIPDDYEPEDE